MTLRITAIIATNDEGRLRTWQEKEYHSDVLHLVSTAKRVGGGYVVWAAHYLHMSSPVWEEENSEFKPSVALEVLPL